MKDNQATTIRLDNLKSNGDDLRTTSAQAAADAELRASILAHGLLEPLVVRKIERSPILNHMPGDPEWHVIAGHRRLHALRSLADAGQIAADSPIDCTILDAGVDTAEAALAENVVRVAMNRADQVSAFKRLVDAGATVEDIAVRFGTTANTVERRLRLATLAPRILDGYRKGEITEQLAQAYATTADQKRQLEAFEWVNGQYYSPNPHSITQRLQHGFARSDRGMALFVGMDAYTAAGGASEATLFEDYSVLSDVELLTKLADEKLAAVAAGLVGEWKWADYTIDNQINLLGYTRLYAETRGTATEAEDARLSELADFMDQFDGADWDELDDEQREQYANAEREVTSINQGIEKRTEFSDEQKAASGVLLHINHDGSVGRYEGLVKEGDPVPGRDDPPAGAGESDGAAPAAGGDPGFAGGSADDVDAAEAEKPKQRGYSQGLRESITELRNAVLRDVLSGAPEVARDLLAFSLILSIKYGWDDDADGRYTSGGYYPDLPLSIRKETPQRLPVQGATAAMKGYMEAPKLDLPWFDKSQPIGVLFESYRKLDQAAKDEITAQVAATLLYCKPGGEGSAYDAHAAIEAELEPAYADTLLNVCPQTCWSAETIWNRLRKDQIIDECRPVLGDEWATEAAKLKKKELAEDAATRMREHPQWLPKGFRAAARPELEPEGA